MYAVYSPGSVTLQCGPCYPETTTLPPCCSHLCTVLVTQKPPHYPHAVHTCVQSLLPRNHHTTPMLFTPVYSPCYPETTTLPPYCSHLCTVLVTQKPPHYPHAVHTCVQSLLLRNHHTTPMLFTPVYSPCYPETTTLPPCCSDLGTVCV